jgi:hypothetical protein
VTVSKEEISTFFDELREREIAYLERIRQLVAVNLDLMALAQEVAKNYDVADWIDERGSLARMAKAALAKIDGGAK